jgi:hypothetical protein
VDAVTWLSDARGLLEQARAALTGLRTVQEGTADAQVRAGDVALQLSTIEAISADGPMATATTDPDCRRCWDYGVVTRNTPSDWETPYQGRPLRGRYLDPCPAVGCKARVREFGA